MGKLVKFCGSCDEGFAEKFGFCPNCGQTLQTFEMNPIAAETSAGAPAALEAAEPTSAWMAPDVVRPVEMRSETAPVIETPESRDISPDQEIVTAPFSGESDEASEEPVAVTSRLVEPSTPVAAQAAVEKAPAPAFYQTTPMDADSKPVSLEAEHSSAMRDGDFYVTVIEEKNTGTRNGLMLGTLGVMLLTLMAGMVINLFSKDLQVGSINDDIFNALLIDDVPAVVEEEVKPKEKDDGGGGGGGGREEKEETTQGDLADQSPKPTRPPDAKVFRSDNFELVTPPPQTEGNRTFEKKFDRWGDPNGRFASFSNGTGSGGGQGSGTGTGQGSGRGTGAGSGDGSGSGSGLGSGNGSGTGTGGSGGAPPPPPARPVGVTAGLKIISKPRPGYTDAARQNNIQGTVVLRVTFLGSGQIGSISAVKGLPNGLTEQAIAAARRINFEPAKRDGVGQTVSRPVEYTFSIY